MEGAGARRLLSAKQRRRKLLSGTQSTVCVNSGEIFCSSENVCKSAGNVCAVDLNEAGQVQSWNHNTIVFKLPPGQGTKVYLNLKVGNQGNDGDKYIYLSYNSPTITSVLLASGMGAPSGPTTGQTVLKVIGSNFGCPKTQTCTASALLQYAMPRRTICTAIFGLTWHTWYTIVKYT